MRVSHETIYRSLFIQARGVLKRELVQLFETLTIIFWIVLSAILVFDFSFSGVRKTSA
jgi:hypothetical protein